MSSPRGTDAKPNTPAAVRTSLSSTTLAEVETLLAPVDAELAQRFPGERSSRQPVHTVYVPADRYHAGLAGEWGEQAIQAVQDAGGMDVLLDAVLTATGVPTELAEPIGIKVAAKLSAEPVEDLRIDLEDGYGDHGDAEDDVAVAAARSLRADVAAGSAAPFAGIRFKCFEEATRARGLRSLDLFLTTLLDSGPLPGGLLLTLPKVTYAAQVQAMVAVCAQLEVAHDLAPGRLGFEVQVETPQAVLGPDGAATVARMLDVGQGRVTGLHYGTYDYSASLGIAAAYQSMEHPVADHAKAVMQLAAAGTGVRLSDGSTNVLPVGGPQQVRAAWALHGRLVHRSLVRGYYQGWDMHPAQLPSRYAATYAFFRQGMPAAADRLRDYIEQVEGAVLDEPATAKALARYLQRGLDSGAVAETELQERAGLGAPDVASILGSG